MSLAWHCDNPNGCDSWILTSDDMDNYGFIEVSFGHKVHFCSWDCVMAYSAYKPALTIVGLQ